MTWTILYKCRRCGVIHGTCCGSEQTCKDAILQTTILGTALGAGFKITMLNTHFCKDGCYGVSDLVGAGPYEEYFK